MSPDNPTPTFGCPHCIPASPDAAWRARLSFRCVADLIDESHYHVMVLACPQCTQHFVSVFTETIDWVDGDDPQCWTLMPLTNAESQSLIEHGSQLSEAELSALAPRRRSLTHEHPKGTEPSCGWGYGIWVRSHD